MRCIVSLEIFLSGASPPRLPGRLAAHARPALHWERRGHGRQPCLPLYLSLSLSLSLFMVAATRPPPPSRYTSSLKPPSPWRTRSLPRRFTSVPPPSLFVGGASSLPPRLVVYVMRASLDQGHPKSSSTAHAIITSSSVARVRLTSLVGVGGRRVSLA